MDSITFFQVVANSLLARKCFKNSASTYLVEVPEQQRAFLPDPLDLGEVVVLETTGPVRTTDHQALDQGDGDVQRHQANATSWRKKTGRKRYVLYNNETIPSM